MFWNNHQSLRDQDLLLFDLYWTSVGWFLSFCNYSGHIVAASWLWTYQIKMIGNVGQRDNIGFFLFFLGGGLVFTKHLYIICFMSIYSTLHSEQHGEFNTIKKVQEVTITRCLYSASFVLCVISLQIPNTSRRSPFNHSDNISMKYLSKCKRHMQ